MELYPFQKADVEKIAKAGSGAIGSEMGTGKTYEAIALMEGWYDPKSPKPDLVIAPLNTFDGWIRMFGVMSPKTDVVVIDRKNRAAFVEAIRKGQGDVFLMHWEALRLMPELNTIRFGTIVADEAHRLSNRKSQQFRAMTHLKADHKLAMSGTLSGDKPEGLWGPFHWLWPRYYRGYWKFRKMYCIEEVQYPQGYSKIIGVQNIGHLMEEVAPWYIRHLKREKCCPDHPDGVMYWLPDKTYDTVWVELSPQQRRIYEQMRKEMLAWVGEHEDSPLVASVVVAQMTRLSQMALATPHIEDGRVRLHPPSSKLDVLEQIVKDHPEKQFVVATSSKQMAYMIHERLPDSFVLSGDTPQKDRTGMVERFQNKDTQLFVGVIAAMAEGIDGLQFATDTMIFMDRDWSTLKNKQCEDRLHRDGQKDTVQIIDIMARNTVDLGRRAKLEKKWAWIKTILGDGFDNAKYEEE